MAGKRVGLAIASGLLTLLGTMSPRGDLEYIVAQDTKPTAEFKEEQPDTYKKIAEYFTNSANEFYKAKDNNKTKEAANLALTFDPENQTAKDLIQKAEKNKQKTDQKALKKAEENYAKNKQQAINDLYNSATQKLQTDKKEALKILDEIWKIDEKNEKPLELRAEKLNWKKNETGTYVPPIIWEARENGKKIFNEATEGEKDDKKDDLEAILGIKPYRRSGNQVISRSPVSDERAKQMHKASEAGLTYFSFRVGIEGNAFEGTKAYERNKKEFEKEGGRVIYRVTEFYKAEDFDKYCEKIAYPGQKWNSSWGTLEESWKRWTETSEKVGALHPGHFHHFPFSKPDEDAIIHNLVRKLLYANSKFSSKGDSTMDHYPSFLEKGICYLLTAEIKGTTSNVMVYAKEDRYEGWKEHAVKVGTPDGIRSLIYEQVEQKKDPSFEYISTMTVDKMQPIHVAKSFSMMEFLFEQYNKETTNLLTNDRADRKKDFYYDVPKDEIVKKAYGKTPAELDSEWKEWVLENYIGYRQIKN